MDLGSSGLLNAIAGSPLLNRLHYRGLGERRRHDRQGAVGPHCAGEAPGAGNVSIRRLDARRDLEAIRLARAADRVAAQIVHPILERWIEQLLRRPPPGYGRRRALRVPRSRRTLSPAPTNVRARERGFVDRSVGGDLNLRTHSDRRRRRSVVRYGDLRQVREFTGAVSNVHARSLRERIAGQVVQTGRRVTRTRVPTGKACSATKPIMRGVSTVKWPSSDGSIVTWSRHRARTVPRQRRDRGDRFAEDHANLRERFDLSAIGEIEAIQGGNAGLPSAPPR